MSKLKTEELKLTTRGAISFEEKTGRDIVEVLKEINEKESFSVGTIVSLYECMGEGNSIETFDAWDEPFAQKAMKVIKACSNYLQGKSSKK